MATGSIVSLIVTLDRETTILITCAKGLIDWLVQDLARLGYQPETVHRTSVTLKGTMLDCMRLNLGLFTAFEVLYFLDEFPCRDGDQLYQQVMKLPWEEWIDVDEYLTVTSRVDTPSVNNSMFPSLKVKDAIVDRINSRAGRRPDSGPDRNGVVVTLYWKDNHARIYFNTSGSKLADRGYRRIPLNAPMQETLAAAVLLASGYDGTKPLVAPMCGSGTLAIEAALIATGRAPGLLRANFGLNHIKGVDLDAWKTLRRDLQKKAKKHATPAPIIASDVDERAIEAARKNATTAGVERLIEFHVCDFTTSPIPTCDEGGVVILNPEYGLRLGDVKGLEHTYGRIGDFFKTRCQGYTGCLFTGNLDLAKKIGLKASRRIPFLNGGIDCRLLKYEIYIGSRRDQNVEASKPSIEA
ncbi:MAG: class I SAM-dependent RNA methyltransferase [Planctomycetota bacterium]|nr:class I SAM-dependent RNA methyltransferase [Planctomycetota bacterium]